MSGGYWVFRHHLIRLKIAEVSDYKDLRKRVIISIRRNVIQTILPNVVKLAGGRSTGEV